MGDVIRKKLFRYTIVMCLCTIGLYLFSLRCLYQSSEKHMDYSIVRVEVNQFLHDFESGLDVQKEVYPFRYCIIDSHCEVLFSTMQSIQPDQIVNLHKFDSMNAYIVPTFLEDYGSCFVYVDGQELIKKQVKQKFFRASIPLHVLFVCFFIFLMKQRKVEREDVWTPIQNLHLVTKEMLRGNFNSSVTYDYDGDLGSLCHDFENMREELLAGYRRENKAKEKEKELYASISHDLKTPIASIRGYLEEIIYGVITEPKDVRIALERMLQKAEVLTNLIEDILEHSKAELNQLTIVKEEVYAREYFRELLSGFAKDAKLHDYEFTYTLPKEQLIFIDERRIAEVMQNLIENAVKYRTQHLKIEITFEQITEPESMLIINVKDNGAGIEASDQPFIFDLFFRGNKARTQEIPGSGLGLNIVKYIIEQHKGQIQCDSILGVGTTMSFSLPII